MLELISLQISFARIMQFLIKISLQNLTRISGFLFKISLIYYENMPMQYTQIFKVVINEDFQ